MGNCLTYPPSSMRGELPPPAIAEENPSALTSQTCVSATLLMLSACTSLLLHRSTPSTTAGLSTAPCTKSRCTLN